MADFSALEELLLGGYDVGALLASQQQAGGASSGILAGLGGLKAQQGLGWGGPGPSEQSSIYQEVAQSLAAKLEEHRMQQVQVATALQTLQQLQQQEALASLTQQLIQQHAAAPRASGNPFQRSRTTDLESMGRGPSYDPVTGAFAPSLHDFDQRQQYAALQHAAASSAQPLGLQRVQGVMGHQHNHNLPVRSFSSEHLIAGQRRPPSHQPTNGNGNPGQPAGQQQGNNSKRAPIRQPSGLGPNGRQGGQGSRAPDGGRRARYAATAKAPSWASEDWHPMKAVIASGAQASGGTGVFLPHLASAPAPNGGAATPASIDGAVSAFTTKNGLASPAGTGTGGRASIDRNSIDLVHGAPHGNNGNGIHRHSSGHSHHYVGAGMQPQLHTGGAASSASHSGPAGHPAGHSPLSPRDGSPSCSVDSNTMCSTTEPGGVYSEHPYSRGTTIEFSRASTCYSELDSHPPSGLGYLTADPMKVVVEEPEREREDANEECDFASLARELAELMSKQAIVE